MKRSSTHSFKAIFASALLLVTATAGAQAPGDWQYAAQAGGANGDVARGIATDAAGNSYVTGYIDGAATFTGNLSIISLTSNGGQDAFLAKYDAAGYALWAVKAGGSGTDQGLSVSIDNNGNSYVTGDFSDTATFYGTSNIQLISNGSTDVFVAKYDASGNVLWAVKAGGSGADVGDKIKNDASGNSYVAGYYQNDSLMFYGAATDTLFPAGAYDIFVAKFDATGDVVWASNAGGSSNDNGYGLAIDESTGSTYITGTFLNTAYFYNSTGKDSITSQLSSNDIFVAKYDANGDEVWVRSAGSNLTDQGSQLAVDGSGNVYVTGNSSNNCTFYAPPANITLASSGLSDVFLASYDAVGNIRWAKHAGGSGGEFSSGLNFNASNHCVLAGAIGNGTATFYGSTNIMLTSNGSSDLFVAEYDTSGNVLCAQNGGGVNFDRAWDVSSDAAGNNYVAGQFNGAATFQAVPTFTLNSYGGSDVFVGKWISSCNATTGISKNDLAFGLYPDPVANELFVELNGGDQTAKFEICDVLGKIWSTKVSQKGNVVSFDLSSLPRGVYFVKMQQGNGAAIRKFMKE